MWYCRIYTMVLLCFVLLFLVDSCNTFTHILQGCFTGTKAVIELYNSWDVIVLKNSIPTPGLNNMSKNSCCLTGKVTTEFLLPSLKWYLSPLHIKRHTWQIRGNICKLKGNVCKSDNLPVDLLATCYWKSCMISFKFHWHSMIQWKF